MKNVERGSIKHLILLIITISICGIIIYPLFDLVLYKFITNSEFTYSVKSYIIQPFTAAVIAGIALWTACKKRKK